MRERLESQKAWKPGSEEARKKDSSKLTADRSRKKTEYRQENMGDKRKRALGAGKKQ
jgi:hypothetical protein